eukprot:UN00217
MMLQLVLLFLASVSIKEETCMAGDRTCMTVDMNGLDDVMQVIPWVSYMSDRPVVKREMPIAAKFRNFRDELVYQYYDGGSRGGTFLGQIAAAGGFGGKQHLHYPCLLLRHKSWAKKSHDLR